MFVLGVGECVCVGGGGLYPNVKRALKRVFWSKCTPNLRMIARSATLRPFLTVFKYNLPCIRAESSGPTSRPCGSDWRWKWTRCRPSSSAWSRCAADAGSAGFRRSPVYGTQWSKTVTQFEPTGCQNCHQYLKSWLFFSTTQQNRHLRQLKIAMLWRATFKQTNDFVGNVQLQRSQLTKKSTC